MMVFFIPFKRVRLCQFYSITSPVLFIKNNKLKNEKKEDFNVLPKELENRIFRQNTIFRHMYLKITHTDKVVELKYFCANIT